MPEPLVVPFKVFAVNWAVFIQPCFHQRAIDLVVVNPCLHCRAIVRRVNVDALDTPRVSELEEVL